MWWPRVKSQEFQKRTTRASPRDYQQLWVCKMKIRSSQQTDVKLFMEWLGYLMSHWDKVQRLCLRGLQRNNAQNFPDILFRIKASQWRAINNSITSYRARVHCYTLPNQVNLQKDKFLHLWLTKCNVYREYYRSYNTHYHLVISNHSTNTSVSPDCLSHFN